MCPPDTVDRRCSARLEAALPDEQKLCCTVTDEINRMLEVGIIFRVQRSEWVSPIVISLKDTTQIRICVDFRCLNVVTIKDPFLIPFTDSILEEVAGHEIYSFMDGFSGYN